MCACFLIPTVWSSYLSFLSQHSLSASLISVFSRAVRCLAEDEDEDDDEDDHEQEEEEESVLSSFSLIFSLGCL